MDNANLLDTQATEQVAEEPTGTAPEVTTNQPKERTFSQEEVNDMVKERLARERKRTNAIMSGDYESNIVAREKAVLERELKMQAKERLQDIGLPTTAAELLKYGSEDEFEESYALAIQILGPMMSASVAQQVKKNLAGTPPRKPSGSQMLPLPDPLKEAFKP